jgi:hypothetical protein
MSVSGNLESACCGGHRADGQLVERELDADQFARLMAGVDPGAGKRTSSPATANGTRP